MVDRNERLRFCVTCDVIQKYGSFRINRPVIGLYVNECFKGLSPWVFKNFDLKKRLILKEKSIRKENGVVSRARFRQNFN